MLLKFYSTNEQFSFLTNNYTSFYFSYSILNIESWEYDDSCSCSDLYLWSYFSNSKISISVWQKFPARNFNGFPGKLLFTHKSFNDRPEASSAPFFQQLDVDWNERGFKFVEESQLGYILEIIWGIISTTVITTQTSRQSIACLFNEVEIGLQLYQ